MRIMRPTRTNTRAASLHVTESAKHFRSEMLAVDFFLMPILHSNSSSLPASTNVALTLNECDCRRVSDSQPVPGVRIFGVDSRPVLAICHPFISLQH